MKTIRGVMKRLAIVAGVAFLTSAVLLMIFSVISPSFLPLRLIREWGFRMASDDVARMAAMPIAFVSPALLLIGLMPAFPSKARLFAWAYAGLSLAGLVALATFLVRAGKRMPSDTFAEMKSLFVFTPICAVAVVLVGILLINAGKKAANADMGSKSS